ncbi:hemerythrin domain-containing protein [Streptomyces sp. NPDC126510]|uniref:hemerythrin domain-containing protein n=1 Tax=Streptomyces sp. NPDC126510 TaxID=3155317 RepID=UPI00333493D9
MSAQFPVDDEPRREKAAELPDDDVVAILLRQHSRVRALFGEVRGAEGARKQDASNELRALLAVQETAEEMIARPAAKDTAGEGEAHARNAEEQKASKVLAELEKMDLSSQEFDVRFPQFQQDVLAHAGREEAVEFPALESGCTPEQRQTTGRRLLTAERAAPTHPHPTTAGSPVASHSPAQHLSDRTQAALPTGSGDSGILLNLHKAAV